ncbi:MAG: hypothetical protein M0Z54_05245 [Thermaerobacter sp.]|nr:hypothetical protein [Thermaerobacter sp.]
MTAQNFQWDPERVGERSRPILHEVSAEVVAAFRAAVDPASVADPSPSTLAVRLQTLDVPGLTLPPAGVIHASQEFLFPAGRALKVGERVRVVGWLDSVRQRARLAIVVVVNQMTAAPRDRGDLDDRPDDTVLLVETRTTVMVTVPDGVIP